MQIDRKTLEKKIEEEREMWAGLGVSLPKIDLDKPLSKGKEYRALLHSATAQYLGSLTDITEWEIHQEDYGNFFMYGDRDGDSPMGFYKREAELADPEKSSKAKAYLKAADEFDKIAKELGYKGGTEVYEKYRALQTRESEFPAEMTGLEAAQFHADVKAEEGKLLLPILYKMVERGYGEAVYISTFLKLKKEKMEELK